MAWEPRLLQRLPMRVSTLARLWILVSVAIVYCYKPAPALQAVNAIADTPNAAQAKAKPNVLFIAVDDLNDYALGLDSQCKAKTPNLERLASRGTLFANAHCAAPACNPSRVSVLTGMAPFNSGVYLNSQDWRESERLKNVVTLPQHFRENGYRVIGGGKLYHAANLRETMLEGYFDPRPWDEYFPSKSRQLADEVSPAEQAVNGSNEFYRGRFDWNALEIPDNEMGDGKVVSWAEEQLSKDNQQPLFLSVGIYRPHIPWYTPKKWFDENPLDTVSLPENVGGDLHDIPDPGINLVRQPWHQWLEQNEKWEQATQAYLASASFADAMVGRLIDALDKGPLADNTIVILWSDHGYHLGHKRHWEKFTLWNQATHVPMIIVDRRHADSSGRCERPVSLLDLYPTLSELCGFETPSHLDGVSLIPFLKNATASSSRSVVITHGRGNHAVQSEHWRYIRYYDGSEELYDQENDPSESVNLASDSQYAARLKQLARQLPAENVTADPVIKPSQDMLVVSLANDRRIDTFSVSGHNHLQRESQTDLAAEPGATVFDAQGQTLYVSTTKPDTITVCRQAKAGFQQTQAVSVPSKPSFLELSPDGKFLLAAYYRTGQVTVHSVDKDGLLSNEPVQTIFANERAHAVTFDPTGRFVFVPHTKPNLISQFIFDSGLGQLTRNQPPALAREANSGPRHLRFHPNANFAYGSDEQGCSISTYAFAPESGTLSHLQTISSIPPSYAGEATTSDVEIHPGGKFAYIANRNHGSIGAFAIDQESFELTPIQNIKTEDIPRSFNISPSGKYLVAGGQRSGKLVCYRITEDGTLQKTTHWTAGKSVNWVSFFPTTE